MHDAMEGEAMTGSYGNQTGPRGSPEPHLPPKNSTANPDSLLPIIPSTPAFATPSTSSLFLSLIVVTLVVVVVIHCAVRNPSKPRLPPTTPLAMPSALSPLSMTHNPVRHSPLNPASATSSPSSSPLSSTAPRPQPPKRSPSFPASRPLRPFPSIKAAVSKPTVKLIQPPAGFCGQQFFVINMTQGELARQC